MGLRTRRSRDMGKIPAKVTEYKKRRGVPGGARNGGVCVLESRELGVVHRVFDRR